MQSFPVPNATERKALWFLALVATSGSAVRLWRVSHDAAPPATGAALQSQIDRVDSVRHMRPPAPASRRLPMRRPPADTATTVAPISAGPVDMDRAAAAEIVTLPGVTRAMAERIVANRDSAGPFGSLNALCWRIRGVGPATIKRWRTMVTFSAAPGAAGGECGAASEVTRKNRRSTQRQSR